MDISLLGRPLKLSIYYSWISNSKKLNILDGEGNSNPLQCSCLENPRDGGAWWAAVYGVAQSWTRLKQLSSSSIFQSFYSFFLLLSCCALDVYSNLCSQSSKYYMLSHLSSIPRILYPCEIFLGRSYKFNDIYLGTFYPRGS